MRLTGQRASKVRHRRAGALRQPQRRPLRRPHPRQRQPAAGIAAGRGRRRAVLGWRAVLEHAARIGADGDCPSGDTLCFMVDLWSAEGAGADHAGRGPDAPEGRHLRLALEAPYRRLRACATRCSDKLRELYARLPAGSRTAAGPSRNCWRLGCDATLAHRAPAVCGPRLAHGGQGRQFFAGARSSGAGSRATAMPCARSSTPAGCWQVEADTAVVVHELPPA